MQHCLAGQPNEKSSCSSAVTAPLLTTQRVLEFHGLWLSAVEKASAAAREALAQGASPLSGTTAGHGHASHSSVSAPLGSLRPSLDTLPECGEVSAPPCQAFGSMCCTLHPRREVRDIPAVYGLEWELR